MQLGASGVALVVPTTGVTLTLLGGSLLPSSGASSTNPISRSASTQATLKCDFITQTSRNCSPGSPLHDDKIKFKTHCRSESKTIKVEHSPTRSPFRNESRSKTKDRRDGIIGRPSKESSADCRNRRINSKDCNIRSVEFEKRRDEVIRSKETMYRVGFEEQTVIKDPNMESDEYSKATRDCSRFESGEKRDRSVMDQIDGSVGRSFQSCIGSYEHSIKDNRSGEESNQIDGNPIRSKEISDPNVMSEQQRIVESRELCYRSPIRLGKAKDQRERIITNQIIESADCRDEVIVRLKEALDKGLGSGECRQCVAELKEFREEVRRSRRRERTRDVDVRYISNLKSYIDKLRSNYSCDPLECPSLRERLAKHQGQHHDHSSSHPLQMNSIGLRNQFQDQASEETPLHSRSPFRDPSRLRSTRDSSSNKNNTAQTKLTFADLGNLTINIESKYNKNQDRNKDRNKKSYKRQRSADKYSNSNRFKLEDDSKHKYSLKHCCKQDAESNYSTSRYDSHLNRNTNNDNINDGRSYSITQTNNYSGRNSCKSPQRYTKPSTRSCKPDDVTEYPIPRTESKHTMVHAKRCYERNPSISHRNSDKYPNRYDTKSKENKEPISHCEAECSALVTPKRTCKTTNSYRNDSSHSIPLVNTETRECLVPKRISYSYEENVKEEVREWLNNVPLYQDSSHALIDKQNITNHFINNIIELSKDNQTEVYEDVLRSHINKCLDTLNVMYPSDKCDHQPFKQNLCETLMKRLKDINDKWLCNRKCNNFNARNRCSSVPRNKSKSNHSIKCTISSDYICDMKRMKMESKSQGACKESCSLLKREMEHEISSWLDELNFIKRDEKQVVTKKDVVGILASRLAPYLKKPYNAANRIILKAKIVEILDGLPICISCSKNQRVRLIRFAEELAKRLLSIQTRLENVNSSSIKSSAEANTCDKFTKINFRNYIHDDIRYCLENTAVTNLKDVENEITDVVIRNFESLCFGNDRCVRNDIVNILQSAEELSTADVLKIVDCILENVKDIIKQESTGKTLSSNPTKTLIKPCLSVYKSEHTISGPSFISSLTSTPKKQTDVVNRDISKLNSEERSYVNHLSDLIRSWMNKLPEQFNSSLDKNFKETIIVDLAGDIMDQNKSEQISLNPNIDKEKFKKYFIYRWLYKLDVFEDLNLAEPQIKDLMIRLKQIPIPDMRGSQLGSRQCMEFLQGDASTEYLKVNTRDVLKDEIFMWMNEQPSEIYSNNDKSVQNKRVEDLAQKLQRLLINKEPDEQITNDIGNWLNKIVKSREKQRLDKMSKELTERLLRLAQDATLTANFSSNLTIAKVNERIANVPLTEETMKRFSYELGYAKEISEWLKNLSFIELANPNIKAKMISDLSERISERDQKKSANLNDTHADTNLVNYITKWIMKLSLDNIKELDIPIATQQLMNRINNVNDEKKRRNGGQSQISQLQCIIECRRSSSKSKKRKCCRKSECMKQKCNDPKGLIVEIIENWSNDLPIEGKDEAVKTVKSNISRKLFQKVGELNDNPIIYNDDHSFRYVLSDEVDLQLHNIPRELKLIGDKDDLKYELLEDVMLAKNVIKEIDAGEIYEQKLESTIETSMPNPIQKPHHDDPEFQIYKHRLAEKFILDNLDHGEEAVKLKYTKRIQNDIDKYYQSSQNRNAVVLTKEQLYNELYSTLFKVPIPSENAIRDEVEEVKTRAEVDLWFDELPLREPNGVAELLEWDQILKTLAKRIHEIETNESNSDNKIHNEIVKWLGKLPIQSEQERNIGNFAEVLLNRLKSTTEDRKCVTASENPIVIADDNKNTCTRNKCKCQAKKCLCKADPDVSNTGRKKWVTLTSSPQHQEQFIQKRPADIILETVESWCNKLPLHANTCQEEQTNRAIRDDLVTKITVKISELNSHPEAFNNDILYDDLLDNEIENWFYNLPQSAALQASKDTMKYHLKEAMKSIKPLIREGSSRHEYKQELRDTLTKTLEEPKATTADEAALINNAKEEIVDNFVEYVYNLGDDEAQLLPKGKIHEATLKYLLVVEDKNDSDSSVDPMMKGNQLISEMSKVPEPSEVVLKEEVQEIRMKNEVDDFFNEIGFLKDFPVEQELRNETRISLAKELTDIEDTGHTFENEHKMKGEIAKSLRKLDREASPEQIDDFINKLKQNESTRKAPSPKTRFSNDGRQTYSPLHQIDEFDTPNNTPNVQSRYSGPVGVPNENLGATYNQYISAGVNPEGVQWQTIISPNGQVFLQPVVTPLSSRSSSPLRQYPETFIGQPPDNNAFAINSTGSLRNESRYCGPECRSNRREDMFNPMTLQTSLDQSAVDYSGLGQRVTPLTQSPHENSRPPYAPSQRYSDINSGQAAIPTTGQYYHNSGGYVEPWNTTSLGSVGQPTQQAVALIHQPLSGNYNTVENHRRMSGLSPNATARRSMAEIQQNYQMPPSTEFGYTPEQRHITLDSRNFNVPGPSYLVPQSNQNSRLGMNENWRPETQPDGLNVTRISVRPSLQPSTPIFTHPSSPTLPHSSALPSNSYPIMTSSHPTMQQNFNRSTAKAEIPQILVQSPTRIEVNQTVPSVRSSPDFINARTRVSASTAEVESSQEYEGHKLAAPQEMDGERDGDVDYHCACHRPRRRWPYCAIPMLQYCDSLDDFLPVCVEYPCRYNY